MIVACPVKESSSLMSSASFTSVSAAPSFGVSGRSASLSDISMVEFIARSRVATDSWGADIAGPGRALEATDRLGQQLLRKPQHDLGKVDRKGDRQEKHDVQRQRSHHGLAEPDADVLRGEDRKSVV